MKHSLLSLLAGLLLLLTACDKNEVITPPDTKTISGTGSYTYTGYAPFANKPIQVFYHVPNKALASSPILMVFHGNGRDALESRDALIAKSNQYNFIVVVPEFSNTYFKGSDAYHMANIFDNGDQPSPSTLNKEEDWTFSVIDPLFEDIKTLTANTSTSYDVFGHSAGGQITHRFLIFQPSANFNRVVASASGWYTVPDDQIDFPYGLRKSPAENVSLAPAFSQKFTVIVGSDDTDPYSFSLRHNNQSDAQGMNRVERAQHFYERSRAIGLGKNIPFNWQFKSVPNVGHDFAALAGFASDLLYK